MSKATANPLYQKLTSAERTLANQIWREYGFHMLEMDHPLLRGEIGAKIEIRIPRNATQGVIDYLVESYSMEAKGTRVVPTVKDNPNTFYRQQYPKVLELICQEATRSS
jgi:hypothetical protein